MTKSGMSRILATMVLAGALFASCRYASAQTASVQLSVKGQRFQPAEIRAPANTPIVLRIKNLDSQPMEFESVSLRVEKVVPGNSEGVINLRPLKPGRYQFFDDFNAKAKGTLVVE